MLGASHRRTSIEPRARPPLRMSTLTKNVRYVLPLVGVVLGVLVASGSATASGSSFPCWKALLNEWYTGKITTIYQHSCYVEAIDHLPVDVQVYSSAREDIQAAEAAALHNKPAPPESTTLPGSSTTTTTDQNPPKKKKGLIGILDDLTPGNPQSFPLPLLVLGALAILLVIAGGAGMVWQRTHPGDSDQPPS